MTTEGVDRAAAILVDARRVLVSTGAGMSQEAGIPTFRDAQDGLWAQFDPQELATEEGFRAAPARVWSWYAFRRAAMAACTPHAGHAALVELDSLVPALTLVTQNIDGLHQRAGSAGVIELHGSILRNRCLECGTFAEIPLPTHPQEREEEPPLCAPCGGYLRPDVVWFGEILPAAAVERAWSAAGECDAVLVVGTSGTVWPAAELPHIAARRGAPVIEINPEPTDVTGVATIFLPGRAGIVLPQLIEAIRSSRVTPG